MTIFDCLKPDYHDSRVKMLSRYFETSRVLLKPYISLITTKDTQCLTRNGLVDINWKFKGFFINYF